MWEFNYVDIVAATAAQFIVSAIWYTFLFRKLWGKMHGFVVPTIAGSVLFGGTDPKWIVKKIAVQTGAILLSLEVATFVIKSL